MSHSQFSCTCSGGAIALGLALAAACHSAFAVQETPPAATPPAGGVAIEFDRLAGTGQAATQKDAQEMASDLVSARGWELGPNPGGLFVAVASAGIAVGPASKDYQAARLQAYTEAILKAKRELAEFVSAEVTQSVSSSLQQGDPRKSLAAAASIPPEKQDLAGKANLLLHAEMDKLLAERGVTLQPDPATEAKAAEVAQEVILSKEFKSAVETEARAEMSAIQAYRCYETPGTDGHGGGKIAVVSIYSPKSASLQQALLGRVASPTGAPKEKIVDWARGIGTEVLMFTHGTQVRTNQDGEVVLVGFGQAAPVSDSDLAAEAAEESAELLAQQAMRQFMGEFIVSNRSRSQASSLKEMADGSQVYESTESLQRAINSESERLGMAGGSPAYSWTAKHPVTGKRIFGVVYTLSVSSAARANQMFADLRAAGGASAGAGTRGVKPPASGSTKRPPTPTGGGATGVGAEGDAP